MSAASAGGEGALHRVDALVTPTAMAALRSESRARRRAGWERMEWELAETPAIELIQMRAHVLDRSLNRGARAMRSLLSLSLARSRALARPRTTAHHRRAHSRRPIALLWLTTRARFPGVVQATLRVRSQQLFSAYGAAPAPGERGVKVAGTAPGKPAAVVDWWVLEVPLADGQNKWRLAAKIPAVPEGAVVKLEDVK